jgi:multiple sugar transport system ATP-binding protein
MRAEIARVQKRIGVAALYVTHDQTEAMTLGHRVAVLRSGVLQQCDAPQVLYDRPTNLFVAGFIGSPAMNLFEGSLNSELTGVALGSQHIGLSSDVVTLHPGLRRFAGQPIVVGVRPEDLRAPSDDRPGAAFVGEVEVVEALGSELLVHFTNDAPMVQAEDSNATKGSRDQDEESVELSVDCVARIEPRHEVRQGDTFKFSIDPIRLEFFDPTTGSAIWE